MTASTNKRLLALDILRGMTIAGMILVNNPGSWGAIYAPLRHAASTGAASAAPSGSWVISGVNIDKESVRFTVNSIGEIGFKIIDKEPYKTIKFESEKLPFTVNAWIQLKQVGECDTRMKLTLRAELPTMVKMMLGNKLGDAINKIADGLSRLPYQQMI